MKVWVFIADGEVDLVSDSPKDHKGHARDLREMGCEVKVRKFKTWAEAEAYADKVRGED